MLNFITENLWVLPVVVIVGLVMIIGLFRRLFGGGGGEEEEPEPARRPQPQHEQPAHAAHPAPAGGQAGWVRWSIAHWRGLLIAGFGFFLLCSFPFGRTEVLHLKSGGTMVAGGSILDQMSRPPECEVVGAPACTPTPRPTNTLTAGQLSGTTIAEANAANTITSGRATADALRYGTPTRSPIPSSTPVPSRTPTEIPPTKAPTPTPVQDCKGIYIASDNTNIPYSLKPGSPWMDLKSLKDGTKVQGICDTLGLFTHREIHPVVQGATNAWMQLEEIFPIAFKTCIIAISVILGVWFFTRILAGTKHIRDRIPDWFEFPVLYGGGLSVIVCWYTGRWELLSYLWAGCGVLAFMWLIEHIFHMFGRPATNAAKGELDARIADWQQEQARARQTRHGGQPQPPAAQPPAQPPAQQAGGGQQPGGGGQHGHP